jgi:hypothetical protein
MTTRTEMLARIIAERAELNRLRAYDVKPSPKTEAAPGAPVSATAGVTPAPMPAAPAPAPVRAQPNPRPPERYLASAADREVYAYCGADGVLPGSSAGLGYGGWWGPT